MGRQSHGYLRQEVTGLKRGKLSIAGNDVLPGGLRRRGLPLSMAYRFISSVAKGALGLCGLGLRPGGFRYRQSDMIAYMAR